MTMNIRVGAGDQVLLTAADVERWQSELAQAEKVVADLKRKLDAAAVFFPASAAQRAVRDELSVQDWIVRVLAKSQKKLTPREIRAAILRGGGEVGSENYLYTAIQRAYRRGIIEKRDDGYAVVPVASPAGEAGGQPTPSNVGNFTLSGGAVGAVPKAGGT